MTDSITPICDLIESLLSRGLSPGDALSSARLIEAVVAKSRGSGADRRERERLKKARQRAKKAEVSPGQNKGGYILLTDKTLNTVKKESNTEDVPFVPGDILSDWPKDYREQFWTNVPRKVAKADAIKALDKVRRSKLPWATLWIGLLRWKTEAAHSDPKFVKHPATWLNKGCWDDEPLKGGLLDGEQPNHRNGGSSDPILAAARRRGGAMRGNGQASGREDAIPPSGRMDDGR